MSANYYELRHSSLYSTTIRLPSRSRAFVQYFFSKVLNKGIFSTGEGGDLFINICIMEMFMAYWTQQTTSQTDRQTTTYKDNNLDHRPKAQSITRLAPPPPSPPPRVPRLCLTYDAVGAYRCAVACRSSLVNTLCRCWTPCKSVEIGHLRCLGNPREDRISNNIQWEFNQAEAIRCTDVKEGAFVVRF